MVRMVAWAAVAVVVAGLGVMLGLSHFGKPGQSTGLESCLAGSVAGGDIGGPFELVNENGATVTDADVITKPTLVYFGYTFCPDVCPFDMDRNAQAMALLDEQEVDVDGLFITIDPARDTPEYLKDFTDAFHDRIMGLTGSETQVSAAAKEYRAYYRKVDSDDPDYYLMDHSNLTYLMTPDQGFVTFFRNDLLPEQMAERVACVASKI